MNLPERSDHRDALTLTGSLTGLHFDFVNGVLGDSIPEKAYPPGSGPTFSAANRGSWRAHMNAIRQVVEQDLGSAVIFEDDVDWDIRIKDQLQKFALAARALTQPLKEDSTKSRYADTTFLEDRDPAYQPEGMSIDAIPATKEPQISPYGDNWDVLWLGHCGIRRPQVSMDAAYAQIARGIPKGFVVHENDATVPERHYINVFDNDAHARFREDFPDHTRVVHHPMDAICSLTYAVSQRGARSLLYELGIKKFDDHFDIMLREYCDGTDGRDKHVCLTVQPTLFDHHRPAGLISHESDISVHDGKVRDRASTANIRFSTRLNVEKLLRGQTNYDDQFPDTG